MTCLKKNSTEESLFLNSTMRITRSQPNRFGLAHIGCSRQLPLLKMTRQIITKLLIIWAVDTWGSTMSHLPFLWKLGKNQYNYATKKKVKKNLLLLY